VSIINYLPAIAYNTVSDGQDLNSLVRKSLTVFMDIQNDSCHFKFAFTHLYSTEHSKAMSYCKLCLFIFFSLNALHAEPSRRAE